MSSSSSISHSERPLLRLEQARLELGGQAFGPFSFAIRAGERVAILGPSGAGKTTLLKLLARELGCRHGTVFLDERALPRWSAVELSRRRAVLPQSVEVAFGLQAGLVVALGRVARAADPGLDGIVRAAAELACAGHLLERRFDTLSGGEKARIQLARVFAQLWDIEGGLVLVDEPLAALDPGLQFALLESMDVFAAQRGHAVVAILHDINHALLGFSRLLLVKDGRLSADLASDACALPQLEDLYDIALESATNSQGGLIVALTRRRPPPEGPRLAS